jgi:secondary thiamine-phosphate synthase enzyme
MKKLMLQTARHTEFVDITERVQAAVAAAGLRDGVITVYVPHTTAGVAINEHADPDVVRDVNMVLDRLVPWQDPGYRHNEGNSAAHVKAILTGPSVQVIVEAGRLALGVWQGVFFCEFDGPRSREVWLSL